MLKNQVVSGSLVLHQTAGRQRSLVPATAALEQLARTVADNIVFGHSTTRATEAVRPAGQLDRLDALRFGAETAQEFGDRHAGLELNLLVGHEARSVMRSTQITASLAHGVSLLRQVCNQEAHSIRLCADRP